jgi:hypothetical protein
MLLGWAGWVVVAGDEPLAGTGVVLASTTSHLERNIFVANLFIATAELSVKLADPTGDEAE